MRGSPAVRLYSCPTHVPARVQARTGALVYISTCGARADLGAGALERGQSAEKGELSIVSRKGMREDEKNGQKKRLE